MNRLIVILAAAGFASVAGAQQPTEVEQSLEPDAAAVPVGTEASDAPVSDRNCLRYTGSNITASENAKARRAGKAPEKCANAQIGRAHVCTKVTNAHLLCRLLLVLKNHLRCQNGVHDLTIHYP